MRSSRCIDMAYNLGAYFLGSSWTQVPLGRDKPATSPACALYCPRAPCTRRATVRHQRLFTNAATVTELGLDPDRLWDLTTPSAPPKPDPTPHRSRPPCTATSTTATTCTWRGGYFPPRTVVKLTAIPSTVTVTQGGLSTAVKGSAFTHAGLGCFDLRTHGKTKSQVWQQAKELFAVGILAFPRGFNWDSFQGPTVSNISDGNEHLHCIDTDEYSHLHPQARRRSTSGSAGRPASPRTATVWSAFTRITDPPPGSATGTRTHGTRPSSRRPRTRQRPPRRRRSSNCPPQPKSPRPSPQTRPS
jgi:hypothetical protein